MSDTKVIAGRYELGIVLGRGGMAEVRAAWDRRLRRAVAVKTLRPDLAERPAIRRSFEREARAAARLTHPNAVTVFDVGEEAGVSFLVMEQVTGPTLEGELAAGPSMLHASGASAGSCSPPSGRPMPPGSSTGT